MLRTRNSQGEDMDRSKIEEEKLRKAVNYDLRAYLNSWLTDLFIKNANDFQKYVKKTKSLSSMVKRA